MGHIKETIDEIRRIAGKATPITVVLLLIMVTVGASGWLLFYFVTGISKVAKDQTDTVSSLVTLHGSIIDNIQKDIAKVREAEQAASKAAETKTQAVSAAEARSQKIQSQYDTLRQSVLAFLQQPPDASDKTSYFALARTMLPASEAWKQYVDNPENHLAQVAMTGWTALNGPKKMSEEIIAVSPKLRTIIIDGYGNDLSVLLVYDDIATDGTIKGGTLIGNDYSGPFIEPIRQILCYTAPSDRDIFDLNDVVVLFSRENDPSSVKRAAWKTRTGGEIASQLELVNVAGTTRHPFQLRDAVNSAVAAPMRPWLMSGDVDRFLKTVNTCKKRATLDLTGRLKIAEPTDPSAPMIERLIRSVADRTIGKDSLQASNAQDYQIRSTLAAMSDALCVSEGDIEVAREQRPDGRLRVTVKISSQDYEHICELDCRPEKDRLLVVFAETKQTRSGTSNF